MEEIKLPVLKGQTFRFETVILDGKRFENCEFIHCELVYSGGPADASSCKFSPDTVWKFQGHAAIVMTVLPQFGWNLLFGIGEQPERIG